MSPSTPRSERPAARAAPAVAAVALLGTVVIAGVAGGFGTDDGTGAAPAPSVEGASFVAPPTTQPVVVTVETTAVAPKTQLSQPLGRGNYGDEVRAVQARLKELGFDPGPADGDFGDLTRAAVWAFEKLVMQVPRGDATGVVTDDMWQRMQDPLSVQPRRPDAATDSHTEIYLPEQVVIFFQDDKPALISHMSSGTDEEWCEEVTISPGEMGNLDGTEPLKRGECGISNTPGGVFNYNRRVEGVRESALGGMWNPVYFNYGIAIHGALTVPIQPASHGCIRIPLPLSEYFQELVGESDQVFVWDGVKEPEEYGAQLPTFNWIDPDYSTTTTAPPPSTEPPTTPAPATAPASAATPPPATAPAATQPPATPPPVTQPPATRPPTTPASTRPPTTAPPSPTTAAATAPSAAPTTAAAAAVTTVAGG